VNILDWRTAYDFLPSSAALLAIYVLYISSCGVGKPPAIRAPNDSCQFALRKVVTISQRLIS